MSYNIATDHTDTRVVSLIFLQLFYTESKVSSSCRLLSSNNYGTVTVAFIVSQVHRSTESCIPTPKLFDPSLSWSRVCGLYIFFTVHTREYYGKPL
jgi:hypothetical protein